MTAERTKPLCVFSTCKCCGRTESVILQPPMTAKYALDLSIRKFEWRGWRFTENGGKLWECCPDCAEVQTILDTGEVTA